MTHETKHTPGKWEVTPGNECLYIHADKYPHSAIACVEFDFDEDNPTRDTTEEASANARLIAAAPELLEALKRCEQHLCEMGCDCPIEIGDEGDMHTKDCLLGQCQAAIAKAEGKQP